MPDEATLVVIKPDAIQRGLMGAVLARLEELRLEIVGAKAMRVSRELAETHYEQLREKPFFNDAVAHLQGTLHGVPTVLAMVFRGPDAIRRVREVTGATNPEKADPRSIRGQFGRNTAAGLMENVLHASANAQDAQREIALWFEPRELLKPVLQPAKRTETR